MIEKSENGLTPLRHIKNRKKTDFFVQISNFNQNLLVKNENYFLRHLHK